MPIEMEMVAGKLSQRRPPSAQKSAIVFQLGRFDWAPHTTNGSWSHRLNAHVGVETVVGNQPQWGIASAGKCAMVSQEPS